MPDGKKWILFAETIIGIAADSRYIYGNGKRGEIRSGSREIEFVTRRDVEIRRIIPAETVVLSGNDTRITGQTVQIRTGCSMVVLKPVPRSGSPPDYRTGIV